MKTKVLAAEDAYFVVWAASSSLFWGQKRRESLCNYASDHQPTPTFSIQQNISRTKEGFERGRRNIHFQLEGINQPPQLY